MLAGAVGCIFTLSAAVLHLFVTLSTPVINTLPLYNVSRNGNNIADFGVLGACYLISMTGLDKICTNARLGYNIPSAIFGLFDLVDVNLHPQLIHNLATSLVVNPIAAGLCALTVILWVLARFSKSRIMSFTTMTFLVLSFIASLLALALSLAIYLVVRNQVNARTDGQFGVKLGTAFWLSVAAAAVMLLAVILGSRSLCCGRMRKEESYEEQMRRLEATRSTTGASNNGAMTTGYPNNMIFHGQQARSPGEVERNPSRATRTPSPLERRQSYGRDRNGRERQVSW